MIVKDYLQPALSDRDIVVLAALANENFHILSDFKIETAQDLKGRKLRLLRRNTWLLGALTTQGENQGGEGVLSSLARAPGGKYLNLTSHAYLPVFLLASKSTLNRLPREFADAIERAASELAAASYPRVERLEAEALDQIQRRGVTVARPNLATYRPDAAATAPVCSKQCPAECNNACYNNNNEQCCDKASHPRGDLLRTILKRAD